MSPDTMLFLRASLFNIVATSHKGYLDLFLNDLILNKIKHLVAEFHQPHFNAPIVVVQLLSPT